MLEEDLYWQELYDKVDWKAPEKDPPPKEITQDGNFSIILYQ